MIWLIYLTGNAEAFKEDGNVEFKKKRYDIAVDNYTAGIKIKCPDKTLNAVLYSNRAAAQFYKRKSPSYRDLWYFHIVVHVLMHGSRSRNFNRKASPATIFLKFTWSLYLDWTPVYEWMFVRPKMQSPLTPFAQSAFALFAWGLFVMEPLLKHFLIWPIIYNFYKENLICGLRGQRMCYYYYLNV